MFTKKQKTFCSRPLREKDLLEVSVSNCEEILSPDEHGRGILLTILERMKDLAPMGDDDSRSLWIETLCEDPGEVAWYEVTSGSFRDSHYLIISDEEFFSLMIVSGGDLLDSDAERDVDISDFLNSLNGYLSRLVGRIRTSPERYNDYIAGNLPYTKRTGKILRSKRDALMPWMKIEASDEAVDFVKDCIAHEDCPSGYDKIETRAFLEALRSAMDEAGDCFHQFESLSHFYSDADDLGEVFPFMDLKLSDGYRLRPKMNREGKWYISVRSCYEEYLDIVLQVCLGLRRQGIPVVIENPSAIASVLSGEDYVDVFPGACDFETEIGMAEMELPSPNREVSPALYSELVEAIEWEGLMPVKNNPFRL